MTFPQKVGIDFGTTNSAIGRLNPEGRPFITGPIPSLFVFYEGDFLFGSQALSLILSKTSSVYPIRDLKMLLNTPSIWLEQREWSTIHLAEKFFRHLFTNILGESQDIEIKEAVIGTPIRMSYSHRQAIRRAAKRAGVAKVKFVYEPTAALIGGLRGMPLGQHHQVLVVDWGGGTLDLALIQVQQNGYQELSIGGDIQKLGGSQIDHIIAKKLLHQHPHLAPYLEAQPDFERFKVAVEQGKLEILEMEEVDVNDAMICLDWLGETCYLDVETVFEVLRDFGQKAGKLLRKILEQRGFSPIQITHILYSGGTCRSKIIRESIQKYFPQAIPLRSTSYSPQLQTALGCTLLSGSSFQISLAADFAIRQCDDTLCILLPKGETLDVNKFVSAEFLVLPPDATHAVLELGLCHFREEEKSILEVLSHHFQPLKHILLHTNAPAGDASETSPSILGDTVKLIVGLEGNLVIYVRAYSNKGEDEKEEFIGQIPLTIHVEPAEV